MPEKGEGATRRIEMKSLLPLWAQHEMQSVPWQRKIPSIIKLYRNRREYKQKKWSQKNIYTTNGQKKLGEVVKKNIARQGVKSIMGFNNYLLIVSIFHHVTPEYSHIYLLVNLCPTNVIFPPSFRWKYMQTRKKRGWLDPKQNSLPPPTTPHTENNTPSRKRFFVSLCYFGVCKIIFQTYLFCRLILFFVCPGVVSGFWMGLKIKGEIFPYKTSQNKKVRVWVPAIVCGFLSFFLFVVYYFFLFTTAVNLSIFHSAPA